MSPNDDLILAVLELAKRLVFDWQVSQHSVIVSKDSSCAIVDYLAELKFVFSWIARHSSGDCSIGRFLAKVPVTRIRWFVYGVLIARVHI